MFVSLPIGHKVAHVGHPDRIDKQGEAGAGDDKEDEQP
jgi:hypothetical protein